MWMAPYGIVSLASKKSLGSWIFENVFSESLGSKFEGLDSLLFRKKLIVQIYFDKLCNKFIKKKERKHRIVIYSTDNEQKRTGMSYNIQVVLLLLFVFGVLHLLYKYLKENMMKFRKKQIMLNALQS